MKMKADDPTHSWTADPVLTQEEALTPFAASPGLLARVWRWLRSYRIGQSSGRRLHVAETVSLGEKRFVAVVQVDGRHFLLAGGPTNIALLAQLNEQDNFGEVLKQTMTVAEAGVPAATVAHIEVKQSKPLSRPKKAPAPAAAASKRPTKQTTGKASKKTASVKPGQTKAAHRQTAKQVTPKVRFGDIPGAPPFGTKAFEKWLEKTVPDSQIQVEPAKHAPRPAHHSKSEARSAEPSSLPAKQTLNEWLQEARNLPDHPAEQVISEPSQIALAPPSAQSTVEEYA